MAVVPVKPKLTPEQRMNAAQDRVDAHLGRCVKCMEDRDCTTIHNLYDRLSAATEAAGFGRPVWR